MNWWGVMNAIYYNPAWIWIIILQQIFLVLLIFKGFSGNWGGFKKEKK